MSKKLAIKGHPTRGEEVIELLEMMGGINCYNLYGDENYACYIIENDEIKGCEYMFGDEPYVIYALAEFYTKYPFKVGDKVVYTKFGDNCDDFPVTIESMKWTGTTIEYTFNDCVTCLAKDLKMWKGNPDAVISGIYLNSCDYADEVELYLGDYEIEVRDSKTYAVLKKPKYPKTYAECCKVLGCKANHFFTDFSYNGLNIEISNYEDKIDELLQNFRKLRYCRDAYWKIAGEQMGLDKSWEPDWTNLDQVKYCIWVDIGEFITMINVRGQHILAFPTEEMRDAFFKNFKKEIEQCKELL